jgi:hypothetical protein
MNKFLLQQEANMQHPSGFLIKPTIFDGILHWLVGLFQLTEEEQRTKRSRYL